MPRAYRRALIAETIADAAGWSHSLAERELRALCRQNDLWVAGDRVLRFPSWAIRRRPADVAAQIHSALTAAGLPPYPRK